MKKQIKWLLLAVTMILGSILTTSMEAKASTSVDSTINDTLPVTASVVYNDFKHALQGAADALKTTAEHVYTIMIRQQLIDAITFLLLIVISIIGFNLVIYSNKREPFHMQSDIKQTVVVITFLISLLIFIVGLVYIDVIITGFLNPEYGAIKELMRFIK